MMMSQLLTSVMTSEPDPNMEDFAKALRTGFDKTGSVDVLAFIRAYFDELKAAEKRTGAIRIRQCIALVAPLRNHAVHGSHSLWRRDISIAGDDWEELFDVLDVKISAMCDLILEIDQELRRMKIAVPPFDR
jgi:hypothetical protein